MKRRRSYFFYLIFSVLLSAALAIIGNVATSSLPPQIEPYTWLAWPIFVVVLIVSILIAIRQEMTDELPGNALSIVDKEASKSSNSQNSYIEDLADIPDQSDFYGRGNELSKLSAWVFDRNRLVGVFGSGGIGKTSLAAKLVNNTKDKFQYVIWRSIINAPPLDEILQDYFQVFGVNDLIDRTDSVDKKINRLLTYLREYKCLLILDNLETVLQTGEQAGLFRAGYENYGSFIRRLGETSHSSCLIVTSREKPSEFSLLETQSSPIRSLNLSGLNSQDGVKILKDKGLFGTAPHFYKLIEMLSGNPLALKLTSDPIQAIFNGNVDEFVEQGNIVFGSVRSIIEQQFSRLSEIEQSIMFWLAIERQPISTSAFRGLFVAKVDVAEIIEALTSLRRRSLIEVTENAFLLQNMITEYATDKFIELIKAEIIQQSPKLIVSHSILNCQTRNYIRESQARIILSPIVDSLQLDLGKDKLNQSLMEMLSALLNSPLQHGGYGVGNIINILVNAGVELKGKNFSGHNIWQAYLKETQLIDVDFSNCDLSKSVFAEHFGNILTVAYSLDGKYMGAGTVNCDVRIWTSLEGTIIGKYSGHTDWVRQVVFDPHSNTIASCSGDKTIRIWDIKSGDQLKILTGHQAGVRSISFNSTGEILASCGDDQKICLWNVLTGDCIDSWIAHNDTIRQVVFGASDDQLITCSDDKTIQVWDITTQKCTQELIGHTEKVICVDVHPNGKQIASAGEDSSIKVWDVQSGDCILSINAHSERIRALKFNNNGTMLGSGSSDKFIKLWSVTTGELIRTFSGHSGWVRSLAFNLDSSVLLSGSSDQSIRQWDVHSGECLRILKGFTNPIWAISLSASGDILISGSDDKIVRSWSVKERKALKSFRGHTNWLWTVAFNPKENVIAGGCEDGVICVWNIDTEVCEAKFMGEWGRIRSVSFSPNGLLLGSGGGDNNVRIWDLESKKCIKILTGHEGWIRTVVFHPLENIIASSSDDSTIRIWDYVTGECIKVLRGHQNKIWPLAYSPNGQYLASGGDDQAIRIWNQAGDCINILEGHTNLVGALAFSLDSNYIASGSSDNSIVIWSVKDFNKIMVLNGHSNPVRSLAFHPSGELLFSSSEDETIRIWSLRQRVCIDVLRIERPYENLNITNVTGLSSAQKNTLKSLGAIN